MNKIDMLQEAENLEQQAQQIKNKVAQSEKSSVICLMAAVCILMQNDELAAAYDAFSNLIAQQSVRTLLLFLGFLIDFQTESMIERGNYPYLEAAPLLLAIVGHDVLPDDLINIFCDRFNLMSPLELCQLSIKINQEIWNRHKEDILNSKR